MNSKKIPAYGVLSLAIILFCVAIYLKYIRKIETEGGEKPAPSKIPRILILTSSILIIVAAVMFIKLKVTVDNSDYIAMTGLCLSAGVAGYSAIRDYDMIVITSTFFTSVLISFSFDS